METTITKRLSWLEMESMFEAEHDKISIRHYKAQHLKAGEECNLLKYYHYKIKVRHPEGTDAIKLFDSAMVKVSGLIVKSLQYREKKPKKEKPYIVIEIKGGTVQQIYSTEAIQFQVIDHDTKEVNSADQLAIPVEIKSANDIDGVCILAENKFLLDDLENGEDGEDWEMDNGPTGHGDICHSDADSGL